MPHNRLSAADPDVEFPQRSDDGEESAIAHATAIGKMAVWPAFFGTLLGVGLSVWGVLVYKSEDEVYFFPFFCSTLGCWGILMLIQMRSFDFQTFRLPLTAGGWQLVMLHEARDRTGTRRVYFARRNLVVYGVQLIFSVIPNRICLALYIKNLLLLRPLHFHIVDNYSPGQQSRPESTASSAASSYRTTTTTPHPPRPSSSSSPKRDSGISFGGPHWPLKVMNPDVPKRKPVAGVGAEGGHVNPEDRLPPMPEWDGHPTALSVPK
ncbi:hypothetical protein JCM21900_005031 [Sporobolomyces salmonicolor]